ncbi:Ig-like domain-containing protein [Flagellatimonas centrodinii]|uniref:Ig-like domain-containing protein n=1 Tax=Flagellatimonas centrodinii TaxID=2806210 RepID=UPI001FEFFB5E|nr:invasin domain 3-containing protein [Flagellatimonas centrodinii]ULQ46997.1 Ig-like domain-containing protein [Flagellatimonas centrodinii]
MELSTGLRAALTGLLFSGLAACGGDGGFTEGGSDGGGGSGAGSAASLAVSPAQDTVVADGQSSVLLVATLQDTEGVGVAGKSISFTTSAGTLLETSAQTNSNGVAQARLQSPLQRGSATVVARDTESGISGLAAVQFVAGPVAQLQVGLSPQVVQPGASVTVTALSRDANGNPTSDEIISFDLAVSASGGRFDQTTATTDGSGLAQVSFTAGSVAGLDSLRARTAGGLAALAPLTVAVQSQLIADVNLSLGSAQVSAGGGPVSVIADVVDAQGAPVSGASVLFEVSDGTLTPNPAVTNSTGRAIASFSAPTYVTTATIRASIAGLIEEITLPVIPGAPSAGQSSLTANPSVIPADGTSTSVVTVLLNDAFGNPVADGRPVTLLSSAGTIVGGNTQPLASGRAQFTVQAPNVNGVANLSVQDVPALMTTLGFESSSTGEPASLRFSLSAERVSVAGVGQAEQSFITVDVLDSAGNLIDETLYPDSMLNNLRARFIARPNGGETLSGRAADGTVVSNGTGSTIAVRTRDGSAVITLQSGTFPGSVQIEFSVLRSTGTNFANPSDIAARATLPQVSIASGPPHTIVFTQPITDAIEDLNNGNYRLKGKVDVTDRYGNSVPDGTVVNLSLMDSVILHDATGSTSTDNAQLSRSGDSLIRRRCATDPLSGGEATGCGIRGQLADASDFTSTITRNDVALGIQPDDLIFIRNAQSADKKRFVGATGTATSLDAHVPYRGNLVNGEFWVGAARSGAQIAGLAEDGGLVAGTGVTQDGIAEFRVTYPANVRTIFTGCYGYPYADRSYDDRDRRSRIPQSRQVIVSASAGDEVVAINQGDYCFKAIAGGTLQPTVGEIALGQGESTTIGLLLRDGGDTIPLPYSGLACFVSALSAGDDDNDPLTNFALSVNVNPNSDGDRATGVSGSGSVSIQNIGDDVGSATITCIGGDASTEIEVTGL